MRSFANYRRVMAVANTKTGVFAGGEVLHDTLIFNLMSRAIPSLVKGQTKAQMMSPNQSQPPSPRGLSTGRPAGAFTPRRSYTRARASKDRVNEIERIDRNRRSQEKFTKYLKRVIHVICLGGIIALIVYAVFYAPKTDERLDDRVKFQEKR